MASFFFSIQELAIAATFISTNYCSYTVWSTIPSLLNSHLFIIASSFCNLKIRDFGFPGVTEPTSIKLKPKPSNPSTASTFLSKPAARPTGLENSLPQTPSPRIDWSGLFSLEPDHELQLRQRVYVQSIDPKSVNIPLSCLGRIWARARSSNDFCYFYVSPEIVDPVKLSTEHHHNRHCPKRLSLDRTSHEIQQPPSQVRSFPSWSRSHAASFHPSFSQMLVADSNKFKNPLDTYRTRIPNPGGGELDVRWIRSRRQIRSRRCCWLTGLYSPSNSISNSRSLAFKAVFSWLPGELHSFQMQAQLNQVTSLWRSRSSQFQFFLSWVIPWTKLETKFV